MAGDWIKVEKVTPRKLEILAIAAKLGIHADHAFGLCFRFWSWCDDNFAKCDAPSVTKSAISALLERNDFVSAMISVGWLIDAGEFVTVANFDRHLSQTAKQRALTSLRMAKKRSNKCDAPSVTLSSPEKRREEKRVKGKPLTIPFEGEETDKNPIVQFSENAIPAVLRPTGFCDAWKAWLDYRHQTRKPVRLEGQNQAFKRALEIGGDVAAEKLKVAMSNGYQGWDFNDRNSTGGKSSSVTASQRYSE